MRRVRVQPYCAPLHMRVRAEIEVPKTEVWAAPMRRVGTLTVRLCARHMCARAHRYTQCAHMIAHARPAARAHVRFMHCIASHPIHANRIF